MKKLLLLLALFVLVSKAYAQTDPADPTKRINKNLRASGAMGLSELSYTRADSLRFAQGSNRRIYGLNSIQSGYVITHNKNNPCVKGSFFRADTRQIDPLWRIRIDSDNTITVLGPATEFFSGQLDLDFSPKPN